MIRAMNTRFAHLKVNVFGWLEACRTDLPVRRSNVIA